MSKRSGTIEVLLPVGYVEGKKATDFVLKTMLNIYNDVVFSTEIQGGHYKLIIMASFIPHQIDDWKYHKRDIYYYMYDTSWGLKFYEENKWMGLISDKPYPGARVVIPNGMIALSFLDKSVANNTNLVCMAESLKTEREDQYEDFLKGEIHREICVIGTTMNDGYDHGHIKVNSVDYRYFGNLLKSYSYAIVLWDYPHSLEALPLKVAEYLHNGVMPILSERFREEAVMSDRSEWVNLFEYASDNKSLDEVINRYASVEDRQKYMDRIVEAYQDSINMHTLQYYSALVEVDHDFVWAMNRVLEWGAKDKHEDGYWRENPNIKNWTDAIDRHNKKHKDGEIVDSDFSESHMIFVACNAMFEFSKDNYE